MANHVYTYIEVESENPKVFKKLQEMFPESDDWKTQSDGMYLYNKLYGKGEYDRSEFTELMGAKWCHIEDVEADEAALVADVAASEALVVAVSLCPDAVDADEAEAVAELAEAVAEAAAAVAEVDAAEASTIKDHLALSVLDVKG